MSGLDVFVCNSSDQHPFACEGPGECIHCSREISTKHNPDTCALCDDIFDASVIRRREDGPTDKEIYG